MFDQETLAVIFVSLMGLATLMYAVLDGYDLGVGMLLPIDKPEHANTMIASIGPFWDANETWLVLAIGLLLIAFPLAHSSVLQALYLPCTFMLIGLILRGVAFDFRAKAAVSYKKHWDITFKLGSFIASFSQGYMLGLYVMGLDNTIESHAFAALSGIGVCSAYMFIGSAWLVMKTEGSLQNQAIQTCFNTAVIAFIGILTVSFTNLIISPDIYDKWFQLPYALLLIPIPIVCSSFFVLSLVVLNQLKSKPNIGASLPFMLAVLIFALSFFGLAFSFFPYIVPGKLTIWQSVAAPEALNFMLWGALIVVPTILIYTAFSYRVFWGKVRELNYY